MIEKNDDRALLLLTYDESIPEYEGDDFRKILIEVLLRIEINCSPESPVSSTVYFYTSKPAPVTKWSKSLAGKFGENFKFTLSRVFEAHIDEADYYIINANPDTEIQDNFAGFVKEILEKILNE